MRKRYQPRRLLQPERKPRRPRRHSRLSALGYLVLITALSTTATFSSYASTASGTGTIKLAKPICILSQASSGAPVLTAQPDGSYTTQYAFAVSNTEEGGQISDVAMRYCLDISIPDDFSYTMTKNGIEVELVGGQYVDEMPFGVSENHAYVLDLTLQPQAGQTASSAGLAVSMKAEQKLPT